MEPNPSCSTVTAATNSGYASTSGAESCKYTVICTCCKQISNIVVGMCTCNTTHLKKNSQISLEHTPIHPPATSILSHLGEH